MGTRKSKRAAAAAEPLARYVAPAPVEGKWVDVPEAVPRARVRGRDDESTDDQRAVTVQPDGSLDLDPAHVLVDAYEDDKYAGVRDDDRGASR